jgi:hypothetical protein
VLDAIWKSYKKNIATPANWPNNHDEVILKDGTKSSEFKGSVFLLPTVSHEEATMEYPDHLTCEVPSNIPYLRLVKHSDVSGKSAPDTSDAANTGKKDQLQEQAVDGKKKGRMSWLTKKSATQVKV